MKVFLNLSILSLKLLTKYFEFINFLVIELRLSIAFIGINLGLVQAQRAKIYTKKVNKINDLSNTLKSLKISPNEAEKFNIKIAKDGVKRTAFEILSRKGVTFKGYSSC